MDQLLQDAVVRHLARGKVNGWLIILHRRPDLKIKLFTITFKTICIFQICVLGNEFPIAYQWTSCPQYSFWRTNGLFGFHTRLFCLFGHTNVARCDISYHLPLFMDGRYTFNTMMNQLIWTSYHLTCILLEVSSLTLFETINQASLHIILS